MGLPFFAALTECLRPQGAGIEGLFQGVVQNKSLGLGLSSLFAKIIENIICFICIQKHNSLRASS